MENYALIKTITLMLIEAKICTHEPQPKTGMWSQSSPQWSFPEIYSTDRI